MKMLYTLILKTFDYFLTDKAELGDPKENAFSCSGTVILERPKSYVQGNLEMTVYNLTVNLI